MNELRKVRCSKWKCWTDAELLDTEMSACANDVVMHVTVMHLVLIQQICP